MAVKINNDFFEFYVYQKSESKPLLSPTNTIFYNPNDPNVPWPLNNGWKQTKPSVSPGETVWAAVARKPFSSATVSIETADWFILSYPALFFTGQINETIPVAQKDNPSEFFQTNFSVTKQALEAAGTELEHAALRLQFVNNALTADINFTANELNQRIDDAIIGVIDSPLLADLQNKVDVIIPNAITSATDSLNQTIAGITSDVSNIAAVVQTETDTRISNDTALASQINIVAASRNRVFYQNTAPTASSVGDLWFETDNGNRAYRWNGTQWVDVSDTRVIANAAAITSEQTARISADSALATSIQTVSASLDNNIAALSAETTARVDADGALSSQITTLIASVGDNAAAIQTESQARADADSAIASQVTTLSTTVGENTASIQTTQEVVDGVTAQFMVKTDVNGYVSGFGLYNTGATSDFIILADKFAIVTPGETPTVPFAVDVNGVYIPEAFIRDLNVEKINGQIVGTQIADGAISGTKITADAIDGKTITGALIQTNSSGLRVVLGNSNFPIWYGNDAVNATNGLFYTDAAGGITVKDTFKISVGGTDRLYYDSVNNELTIKARLILGDNTLITSETDIRGFDAKTVSLSASSQAIEYSASDIQVGPSVITFTATPQNASSTPYYQFYVNDVAQGVEPTTTATFNYTTPSTYSATPIKIEVEMRDGAANNPVIARDQMSVVSIKPGANTIVAVLSNEAHVLSANSSGVVSTYAGSGTTIKVFDGVTELTYESGTGIPTTSGRFKIEISTLNITAGTVSGNGTTTASVSNASNMIADSATITFAINALTLSGESIAITKIQSLSKAKAGIDGDGGLPGADGASVLVVYADDAIGTNQSTTAGAREFVQYVEYVGTTPTLPVAGAFVRFVGLDGTDGQSIWPIYANDSAGNGQSFSPVGKSFVTFYESLTQPTLPVSGQTFVRYIGTDGVDGADGADGAAGVNAKTVSLTATAQAIEYTATNTRVGPSTITFTATPQNLSSTPYYRFYVNDVAVGAGPTTTATYAYTTPSIYNSTPIKIEVELRDGASTNPIIARDQLSVVSIKPGSDGSDGINSVVAVLSNEAHVLPADSAGTVSSFAGSGTTIKAYDGVTELVYETGTGFPTTNGRFRLAITTSNITAGAVSGSGTTTATVANATAMSADNATITYTINARTPSGQNIAITKVQSFSKSKQGTQGPAGSDGFNAATLFAYKRSATAPTDNPGTITYTFATSAWTPANGWSTSVPANNGNPVYVVSASAVSSATTDTVQSNEWTTPQILSQNGDTGAAGLNTATAYLYQRTDSTSPPTKQSNTLTYTFATGILSGTLNNGWQITPPSTGGKYLWYSLATASSSSSTDSVLGSEWSTPAILSSNGADGQDGANGINGATGAGFYSKNIATTKPTITTAYLTTEFTPVAGRAPVTNDTFFVTWTNASDAYQFNGTDWVAATLVVNGSVIASGTIAGDRLVAGTKISAPVISGGRVEMIGTSYMKVTGATAFGPNNLVEWYGPKNSVTFNSSTGEAILSALTKANAITYLGDDGSAYFGGSIIAGTLRTANQSATQNSNSVSLSTGLFSSNGGNIEIKCSASGLGSRFTAGTCPVPAPAAPSVTMILKRVQPSGTVTVASQTFNGTYFCSQEGPEYIENWSIDGSFTYTDTLQTTSDREYLMEVTYSNFLLTPLSGYSRTQGASIITEE